MATLTCSRCNATTQANSVEEGRKRLDHSVGLIMGKPCEDGKVELFLTGQVKPKKQKAVKTVETKTHSIKND